MAIESKHHRPSPIDHVIVSEGTRKDAQPPNGLTFETYREELDHWISVKTRLESELSCYSKAAFAGEQARIRREHAHDQKASFQAWISRKSSMETTRQKLVKQKNEADDEILRLKPLVKNENVRMKGATSKRSPGTLVGFELFRDDGSLSWDAVAAELLLELRAIRTLLENRANTP